MYNRFSLNRVLKVRTLILTPFIAGLLTLSCDIFQPKDQPSVLVLNVQGAQKTSLAKSLKQIETTHCTVKRDGNTVYSSSLPHESGRFTAEIELDPGSGYSVLLLGRTNGLTVAQTSQTGISLSEGQTRTLNLTWQRFKVQLVTPEDGVTAGYSPQLTWNACPGAQQYALQLDDGANFSSTIVDKILETETNYTLSDSLANGKYFWRVRAKDSRGTWREWSKVWQFEVGVEYLNVSRTSLSLSSASNSQSGFGIESNVSWTVSDDASWLSVSPGSGSDDGTVTVTATSDNPSTESRSAMVTVNGDGVGSKTITVTQSGADAYLTVSTTSLSLSSSSNSQAGFDIESNVSWTVSDDASWLSVSPGSGSDDATVTVTATSANPSTGSRSATVTVSGDGVGSKTITVTQSGADAYLTVSPTSLSLSSSSDSQSGFDIESNVNWTVSDDASWLSVSPGSGSDDATVTVTATSANSSTGSRSATVTVSGDGVSSRTVTVTQSGSSSPISIEWVPVPGGSFQMGSNSSEAYSDEQPVHTVTLSDFKISKYEVTNAQYAAFLNDQGVSSDGSASGTEYIDMNASYCQIDYGGGQFVVESGKDNYPVIGVTWYGAKAFCEWAGGRLPTEAEWEYAARGGPQSRGYTYAGGNTIDAVAWYDGNSGGHTHPVGGKRANELGLYDMSGNVWEWCADWKGNYSSSSQTNPTGPSSGSYRVRRGGGWNDDARYCRVAYRYVSVPGGSRNVLGFRPVQDGD
ncbi:MAG: SUMF1/EgtB/PvdO family nonheme iron enzyme [candidate division KSB1 bacterium]|nr:SUMF1/EgtB/PvdO family nonheme iron enzyme [candidate division KSB1 bacterium]